MIRHSAHTGQTAAGNTWAIGNVVKVGFLRLQVCSVEAVKDGMPDIYTLTSLDGNKRYRFIPHYGLERID